MFDSDITSGEFVMYRVTMREDEDTENTVHIPGTSWEFGTWQEESTAEYDVAVAKWAERSFCAALDSRSDVVSYAAR